MSILIRNATVVTMNAEYDVFQNCDVLLEGKHIVDIGNSQRTADQQIDGNGKIVIPGFVQPHIHLCQTLFRGQADDLELLDWLKKRIWPLEGAHDEESIYYSALLGIMELFKSGTTTILDMETVHHTSSAIQAIFDSGIRAVTGKCMMDSGGEVPDSLRETMDSSVQESVDLLERWHLKDEGRIRYGFMPRFVVSCTDELLQEVRELGVKHGVHIHTHAAENAKEVDLVYFEKGVRNIEHLHNLGLTGPQLVLAHCVWVNDLELDIIARTNTKVAHCPSSNLKLASGIAKTAEWLRKGICFGIAADGAPCNNHLDMFTEMRLAALLQKPFYGPVSMPARQIFELATIGGARVLGLQNEIGSIEIGKKADVVILEWDDVHHVPRDHTDVYSQLVYQSKSNDVWTTIVDGRVVLENRQFTKLDTSLIIRECHRALHRLIQRSGLST